MQNRILQPRRALAAVVVACALAGGSLAQDPGAQPVGELPEVVARIDGQEVGKAELLAQVREIRQAALRSGEPDPGHSAVFYRQALDTLINELLIYNDSRRRGVGPSAEDVDRAVASVRSHYSDEAAFDRALAEYGSDRQKLRDQLRRALTIEMVIRSEIAPRIEITAEAKGAFYERNRDQLRRPERCRVRHILIRAEAGADPAARSAARARAEELLAEIRAGADFAVLARRHSEDAESRDQGGELPWISPRGQAPFERAVAALTVGQVSEVVDSAAGFHLIELLERQPPGVKSFLEAEPEITHLLERVAVREAIQRRVETLRATAEIEILIP